MNIGLFIDVLNLHYCVDIKYGRKLNYELYLNKIVDFGELKWKFAYGTQKKDEADKFIYRLKHLGFDVKYLTLIKNRIITTRVDLIIDIIKLINKLDVVILGTNNLDYIPLIQWIRNQGIKCGVFATRISKNLKEECDFYIEIDKSMLIASQSSTDSKDDNVTTITT